LSLDAEMSGTLAYKINTSKFLSLVQILLVMLTLSPRVALSEITALSVEEVFLEVFINEQSKGVVFLLRSNNRLFVESKDLRSWRLRLPQSTPLNLYDADFYSLDELTGLTYKFDETTQTLMVEAPPSLFDFTLLKGKVNNFSAPTFSPLGGFVNYDLNASLRQERTMTSGMLELGGFKNRDAAQTNILWKDLNQQVRPIRLDSTWVRDQPKQFTRLRFGDVISGASTWGGRVRLGGMQWATNFSIQPDFIPFPLPEMSGEVALPSTVDLYVNNMKRMSKEVPSGPFSIQDLPVITGQGDARLVVRDILGREQVTTQPYYVSPRLLKQGLQDYSYELGFVRRNYGFDSNNYGRPVVVGTHRLGFNDQFTGEFHVELLRNQQTVGLGGVLLSPGYGIFSGSLAMSNSGKGVGGLLNLGIQPQSRSFNFGADTQLASERFAKLGQHLKELAPQQISNMFFNLPTKDYGSFTVNYALQTFRQKSQNKILQASYNRKVSKKGTLSASVRRFISDETSTAFHLNFNFLLGNKTSASIRTSTQSGREKASLSMSRGKSEDNGIGYSVVAGVGDSDLRQAEVNLQNEVGNYTLKVDQSQGQMAFSGKASGGVAFLGGHAFLSRRITDSFAVVHVPGYSDVRIYVENHLVGRTDAKGKALLPSLRAYEKNSVRIEQADLPFDVQIDAVQLDAVPYSRSGLIMKFPVKRLRAALLTVVLENGEPLPAGAQAQIIGDNLGENEIFPTGMRGEVYLTGLELSNRLRVTWRKQSCEFALPFPETTEQLPHLGNYICNGVEP
jgi:outer membrane usher protein